MDPQRPNRYRAPAGMPPPRPPIRPAPGAPAPRRPAEGSDGDYGLLTPDGRPGPPGGPSNKIKALAGLLIVLVFGAGYAMISQPTPPKQISRAAPKAKPAAKIAKAPSRWQQQYETTFRYGGHVVAVRHVTVDKLRSSQPRVRYYLTITPNLRRNARWLTDKRRYSLTVPNNYTNARAISIKRIGPKREMTVEFRWPKALLYSGSRLLLQLPGAEAKPELIGLALEMPKSRRSIHERHGVGGL
jgi:hypothetical protein